MDQNIAALVPLLPGCFGWNLVRTKCLAGLIIALIKVRTVHFAQLATALPDGTLKDSKYKRIQCLFRIFPLDFSTVARFIASQLPEGQYLLTLGRTNWKFGQTHINILCLAIASKVWRFPCYRSCQIKQEIPIRTNAFHISNRFIELFGVEKIDGYLADRESIGTELYGICSLISLKMK